MSRLRVNNVGDPTGTQNPISLTLNGTTATWVSDPHIPTMLAGDALQLTVEPNSPQEEIILVIGPYTTAALTATVVRNWEATQGGANAAPAHTAKSWVHGPSAGDFRPTGYVMALMRAKYR